MSEPGEDDLDGLDGLEDAFKLSIEAFPSLSLTPSPDTSKSVSPRPVSATSTEAATAPKPPHDPAAEQAVDSEDELVEKTSVSLRHITGPSTEPEGSVARPKPSSSTLLRSIAADTLQTGDAVHIVHQGTLFAAVLLEDLGHDEWAVEYTEGEFLGTKERFVHADRIQPAAEGVASAKTTTAKKTSPLKTSCQSILAAERLSSPSKIAIGFRASDASSSSAVSLAQEAASPKTAAPPQKSSMKCRSNGFATSSRPSPAAEACMDADMMQAVLTAVRVAIKEEVGSAVRNELETMFASGQFSFRRSEDRPSIDTARSSDDSNVRACKQEVKASVGAPDSASAESNACAVQNCPNGRIGTKVSTEEKRGSKEDRSRRGGAFAKMLSRTPGRPSNLDTEWDEELQAASENAKKHKMESLETFMRKFATQEILGTRFGRRGAAHGDGDPQKRPRCIVNPQSSPRLAWDVCGLILLVYLAFALPFRLAFYFKEWSLVNVIVDLCVDIFFILDVVLNLNTAFHDEQGQLITSRRAIFKNYARGWLLPDLVASVPFDWFVVGIPFEDPGLEPESESDEDYSNLLHLLRIFKALKLLRLLRLARIARYAQGCLHALPWGAQEWINLSFNSNTMRLVKLLLVMSTFGHWSGCFQFLMSAIQEFPQDCWVVRAGFADDEPSKQFSWAVLTAWTQMLALGIGVVPPERNEEVWVSLFSCMLGSLLYGVFIAALTAVVAEADFAGKEYRHKMDLLSQYMQRSELPRHMRGKLRDFYNLAFPGKRSFDENKILGEINRPLREEVCVFKTRHILAKLHVLDGAEAGLARSLALALQRVVFVKGDYIIREGEDSDSMFFVSDGEVEVLQSNHGNTPITVLKQSSLFGEMALLYDGGRANASVRVTTFCEGYCLTREKFLRLEKNYPTFREYLEVVAKVRLKGADHKKLGGLQFDELMTAHKEKSDRMKALRRCCQTAAHLRGGSCLVHRPDSADDISRIIFSHPEQETTSYIRKRSRRWSAPTAQNATAVRKGSARRGSGENRMAHTVAALRASVKRPSFDKGDANLESSRARRSSSGQMGAVVSAGV